jgi:hypothetical protein
MKILLAILLLLSASLVQAELYKSLDEHGEVVYSDKPPTMGAQEYKPPALQVQPPIKIPPKTTKPVEQKATPYPYSALAFKQPEANADFHDNEANVSYALTITPVLGVKLGHYLNIKLDDTVIASKTSSLTGTLNNVDRGSHTLQAEICNAKGEILRSASVSFTIHKFSSLHQPPPIPAPPKP